MKLSSKFSLAAYMDIVFASLSLLLFALILSIYIYEARTILEHVNTSLSISQSAQQVVNYNISDAQKIDYRGLLR